MIISRPCSFPLSHPSHDLQRRVITLSEETLLSQRLQLRQQQNKECVGVWGGTSRKVVEQSTKAQIGIWSIRRLFIESLPGTSRHPFRSLSILIVPFTCLQSESAQNRSEKYSLWKIKALIFVLRNVTHACVYSFSNSHEVHGFYNCIWIIFIFMWPRPYFFQKRQHEDNWNWPAVLQIP